MKKNCFEGCFCSKAGFTLIELLVVVLIIGILAAVAVPQYRLAVDKSRIHTLMHLTDSVVKAQKAYYLENGKYTTNWDELTLDFSRKNATSGEIGRKQALELSSGGFVRAYDFHVSGFQYLHWYTSTQRACYAKESNNYANKLCQLISNKTSWDIQVDHGAYNVYYL